MNKRIQKLIKRIDDLKRSLPAHSIPPAMMAELDNLEEQLEAELARQQKKQEDQNE